MVNSKQTAIWQHLKVSVILSDCKANKKALAYPSTTVLPGGACYARRDAHLVLGMQNKEGFFFPPPRVFSATAQAHRD